MVEVGNANWPKLSTEDQSMLLAHGAVEELEVKNVLHERIEGTWKSPIHS